MEDHNDTVSQQAAAGSELVPLPEPMEVAEEAENLEDPDGGDGYGVEDMTPPGFESGGDGYGVAAPIFESGGNGYGVSAAPSFASGGEVSGVKRKRGRPRKEAAGMVVGAAAAAPRQELMAVASENLATPQKRGRGRPRGTGKWQTLAASLGGTIGQTAGSDFTPYIIPIQEGENIVQTIWSFSQRMSESILILSGIGTISSVEVHNQNARGRTLTYKDQFSIVYLGGSHTYDDKGSGKICLLSVQLANPQGHLCGGAVATSLIAGGPTQLVIATFRQKVIRQPPSLRMTTQTPKTNKAGPVIVRVPALPENSEPAKLANNNKSVAADHCEPPADHQVQAPISNVGPASPPPMPPLPDDWKSIEPSPSGYDTGIIH